MFFSLYSPISNHGDTETQRFAQSQTAFRIVAVVPFACGERNPRKMQKRKTFGLRIVIDKPFTASFSFLHFSRTSRDGNNSEPRCLCVSVVKKVFRLRPKAALWSLWFKY